MNDDGQALPHLDELRRTQLLLRFADLPRDERRRLRRATTRGEALPTREDRLMQYALLGQDRRKRAAFAALFPLFALWEIGRAISDHVSIPWLIVCCAIFGSAALFAPWAYWRARRLERSLGLTADSFR